jgi:hypothetical protein
VAPAFLLGLIHARFRADYPTAVQVRQRSYQRMAARMPRP